MELPTADEARIKTESLLTNVSQSQLAKVAEVINKAVQAASYSVFYFGTLSQATQDRLVTYGYSVNFFSARDESGYDISWAKPVEG